MLRHTTRTTRAIATELVDRLDVTTLGRCRRPPSWPSTTWARSASAWPGPIAADAYAASRAPGSFILIDEATNDTVGAGLLHTPADRDDPIDVANPAEVSAARTVG